MFVPVERGCVTIMTVLGDPFRFESSHRAFPKGLANLISSFSGERVEIVSVAGHVPVGRFRVGSAAEPANKISARVTKQTPRLSGA